MKSPLPPLLPPVSPAQSRFYNRQGWIEIVDVGMWKERRSVSRGRLKCIDGPNDALRREDMLHAHALYTCALAALETSKLNLPAGGRRVQALNILAFDFNSIVRARLAACRRDCDDVGVGLQVCALCGVIAGLLTGIAGRAVVKATGRI